MTGKALYDFHTHSTLSDGVLTPVEIIRRAAVNGYSAVAITDHVGLGSLERVIAELTRDCETARRHWNILAMPGVELTHLPPESIAEAAAEAKRLGAWVVVVHGETIVEPVPEGTNRAALASPHVDILAHPGLIAPEEVRGAAERGKYLELSARRGHCFTNGYVARLAQGAGARLLLNSDAHEPADLLTPRLAEGIARGAGLLGEAEIKQALVDNPLALMRSIKRDSQAVRL